MRIFDAFYIHGTVEEALLQELRGERCLALPHGQTCRRGNVAAAVSRFFARIGSPCLRHGVHGASTGVARLHGLGLRADVSRAFPGCC
jgi:hypothetical protein